MKDRAAEFKAFSYLLRVDKISVVCNREIAFYMADNERLDIIVIFPAGRGIPNMPYRHIALSERFQLVLGEYIGHKAVSAVMREHTVIINGDSAAFLPSVLQCIEGKISRPCNISGFIFKYSEYSAFLVNTVKHKLKRSRKN